MLTHGMLCVWQLRDVSELVVGSELTQNTRQLSLMLTWLSVVMSIWQLRDVSELVVGSEFAPISEALRHSNTSSVHALHFPAAAVSCCCIAESFAAQQVDNIGVRCC